jgi:hypothetical protein
MTRQEYDAFIDQETTNALVIFNDDITDRPYTPAQHLYAVQRARSSYLGYAPLPPSLAGNFQARARYLDNFLPPPT